MIRLLLVGEHALLLQGLKRLLEDQVAADVRATVQWDEVEHTLHTWLPEVIVVETPDAAAATDRLLHLAQIAPNVPLVVIAPGDEHQFLAALRAGARGFISRDASASNLVNCIEAVHRGEWGLPRNLTGVLVQEYLASRNHHPVLSVEDLTERERSVLGLLVHGWSAQRIGEELYLSESAVRSIIRSIGRKLGTTNRMQIVILALTLGLVKRR
jgi:NarL family two-component system response regulator LiaR